MSEQWSPKTQDLSHISLPRELEGLAEELARNVHNTWARERLQAGWRSGPRRSDALKQTPLLVPYEDLPEEEKVYDRITAMNTLRYILAMGYEIRKVSGS